MDPDFENDILAAISCGLWMISVASLATDSRFELERHTDFFCLFYNKYCFCYFYFMQWTWV